MFVLENECLELLWNGVRLFCLYYRGVNGCWLLVVEQESWVVQGLLELDDFISRQNHRCVFH